MMHDAPHSFLLKAQTCSIHLSMCAALHQGVERLCGAYSASTLWNLSGIQNGSVYMIAV
jgi:hypothetical protein